MKLHNTFSSMADYQGIEIEGVEPGDEGGINVRFALLFSSKSSSVSSHDVDQHLNHMVDDKGNLFNSTFKVETEVEGM